MKLRELFENLDEIIGGPSYEKSFQICDVIEIVETMILYLENREHSARLFHCVECDACSLYKTWRGKK